MHQNASKSDTLYFASKEEEELGIYTKMHTDGSITKTAHLPNCKKSADMRKPTKRDVHILRRLFPGHKQPEKLIFARCTLLNGEPASTKELEDLPLKDYVIIGFAFSKLIDK